MTEEHSPATTTSIPDAIADTAPAAKLTLLLVRANEPTTFGALQTHSHLGEATLRRALDTLLERGLVEETVHDSDQRQDFYRTA